MNSRDALLIATSTYQDTRLRGLVGAEEDAMALASALRDPKAAGFNVTVLMNEPHHVVGEAIGRFYRDRRRDDLALLYFTGHGLKDDDGRLYFAMTDTQWDSPLFTALSADHINYAMETCSSRQKVLVLDCCYSGAFPGTASVSKGDADVHTLERFQGRGRAVLTASDATQYAFEGMGPDDALRQSLFTHFMVRGLRTGEADLDGDGDISLDDLYSYVHDRVIDVAPQQRPKKLENVEGRIVLGRNVHWTLPTYLRDAASSPIASQRLAALDGLDHLHRIGNEIVRAHVQAEVATLAEDDSRAVAAAAGALLHRLSIDSDRPADGPNAPPSPPAPAASAPTTEDSERSESTITESPPARPASARAASRSGAHASPERRGRRSPGRTVRKGGEFLTKRAIIGGLATAAMLAVGLSAAIQLVQRSPTSPNATPGQSTTRVNTGPPQSAASAPTPSLVMEVVSIARPAVVDTIRVANNPSTVVVSHDGRQAYVGSTTNRVLTVINTAITKVERRIPIAAGPPRYIALMRDDRRAYVSLMSDAVAVVDTHARRVTGTIKVRAEPFALSLTPDERYVFVPDHGSEAVSVIRTADNKVADTCLVKRSPHRVVFSGDGRTGYLANHEANVVTLLGVSDCRVLAEIPVGRSPHSLAVSPDGQQIYTTNYNANNVSVIDVLANRVIATIRVGRGPQAVAFAPDARHAYVVNNLDDTISVIDTRTRKVTVVRVGNSPTAVAVRPDGRFAYVSNFRDGTVSVLRVGRA